MTEFASEPHREQLTVIDGTLEAAKSLFKDLMVCQGLVRESRPEHTGPIRLDDHRGRNPIHAQLTEDGWLLLPIQFLVPVRAQIIVQQAFHLFAIGALIRREEVYALVQTSGCQASRTALGTGTQNQGYGPSDHQR